MSSLHQPKPILSWWQLGLLITGCSLGVWWLLPGDGQLIEDLISDRAYEKAAQRLEAISTEERARNPYYYRSLELKLSRITLPAKPSAGQLMQWWKLGTSSWHETQFSNKVFVELLPIIARLPDPRLAWQLAQSENAEIPAAQYQRLAFLLSNAALAANQPETSADLYARAHPDSERTEKVTLELARRWQLAGKPEQALQVLADMSSSEAISLRISLLRTLNRNQEAVTLLRARILKEGASLLSAEDVELLATASLAAGIPQEAVPQYQEFAAEHPEDITIQRRFRDLLVAAGQLEAALPISRLIVQLNEENPEEIRTLAKLSEYAGKPNEAFDQWLKLAELTHDIEAVDRLLAMNPGLYRDAELAGVLVNVIPVPGHDDYILILAQLKQKLGYYPEAEHYFAEYLAAVPNDYEVAWELATLHYELFEYPEAEKWYRHASSIRPDDLETRLAVANVLMMQNRPEDSFKLYGEIMADHPTDEVIANYIRIAESLGRYEELATGLRKQINRDETPELSDFGRLAYTFARMNETALQEEVLKEGLEHFPEDPQMRLALAQLLADRKEYQSAQETLSNLSGLHSDLSAALLYLDLLRLNNDLVEERRYLSIPFAPAIRSNEALLKKEARAFEAIQDLPQAETIWRQLLTSNQNDHELVGQLARVLMLQGKERQANQLLAPFLVEPSPSILKLAAEVSIAAGDYLAAESYQLEFLNAIAAPHETDWGMLGDIRLSRGDIEGATRAYQIANRLMISKLRRPGEVTITKETLIARADTLSLDDRHYLLYLSARVNDAQVSKGLAEHILANNPSDRQTLLVLASMALANRNAQETLRLARHYLSYYPDDYQGLYFLGTGHFLAKEYQQANAVLSELKRTQYQNRKYPFETDLASSALQAGDWYRAMLSYIALLRHHDINEELRSDIRIVLDGIYREHGRRVEFTANQSQLRRAGIWRYAAIHAAHITNRNWLELGYLRDQIDLQAAPGIQPHSRNRDQIHARLTRKLFARWQGDLWLGQYDNGTLGGAALRYRFAQQREISLEQTVNERATDSLALEIIDGRESRTTLGLNWLVEADLLVNFRAHTRSVQIGGNDLGSGHGMDLNIDQIIRRHGPHITVGYRSSIASFSPRRVNPRLSDRARNISDPIGGEPGRASVIRNLVSRHLNRHGAGLVITDNIADAWIYRLTFGTDYDFELSSLGWNGGFYLAFFPRKSIELSVESGYTSSATDSNAGSAATLTNFLFRFYY